MTKVRTGRHRSTEELDEIEELLADAVRLAARTGDLGTTYRLPSIVVLDVSRLGWAGQAIAGAWTGKFQDMLDTCELGNLGGVLVVRSELRSVSLEPLCWRGDTEPALAAAVAAVLLDGQMPKAA